RRAHGGEVRRGDPLAVRSTRLELRNGVATGHGDAAARGPAERVADSRGCRLDTWKDFEPGEHPQVQLVDLGGAVSSGAQVHRREQRVPRVEPEVLALDVAQAAHE